MLEKLHSDKSLYNNTINIYIEIGNFIAKENYTISADQPTKNYFNLRYFYERRFLLFDQDSKRFTMAPWLIKVMNKTLTKRFDWDGLSKTVLQTDATDLGEKVKK